MRKVLDTLVIRCYLLGMVNAVKVLVDKFRVSKEEIAYRVGCSTMSVYRWYSGEAKPLPIYRDKLAELLKVKRNGGE